MAVGRRVADRVLIVVILDINPSLAALKLDIIVDS